MNTIGQNINPNLIGAYQAIASGMHSSRMNSARNTQNSQVSNAPYQQMAPEIGDQEIRPEDSAFSPKNMAGLFKSLSINAGEALRWLLIALPTVLVASLYGGQIRNRVRDVGENFKGPLGKARDVIMAPVRFFRPVEPNGLGIRKRPKVGA